MKGSDRVAYMKQGGRAGGQTAATIKDNNITPYPAIEKPTQQYAAEKLSFTKGRQGLVVFFFSSQS